MLLILVVILFVHMSWCQGFCWCLFTNRKEALTGLKPKCEMCGFWPGLNLLFNAIPWKNRLSDTKSNQPIWSSLSHSNILWKCSISCFWWDYKSITIQYLETLTWNLILGWMSLFSYFILFILFMVSISIVESILCLGRLLEKLLLDKFFLSNGGGVLYNWDILHPPVLYI